MAKDWDGGERPTPARVLDLSDEYERPSGQVQRVKVGPGLVASTVPKSDMDWATDVAKLILVKGGDRLPNGSLVILNEDELGAKAGEFIMVSGDYVVVETVEHHRKRREQTNERLRAIRHEFSSERLREEIGGVAPGVPAAVTRFEQTRVADEEAAEAQQRMKAETA